MMIKKNQKMSLFVLLIFCLLLVSGLIGYSKAEPASEDAVDASESGSHFLTASFIGEPLSGESPLAVTLTVTSSMDEGCQPESYEINFGDGSANETTITSSPSVTWQHTYTNKTSDTVIYTPLVMISAKCAETTSSTTTSTGITVYIAAEETTTTTKTTEETTPADTSPKASLEATSSCTSLPQAMIFTATAEATAKEECQLASWELSYGDGTSEKMTVATTSTLVQRQHVFSPGTWKVSFQITDTCLQTAVGETVVEIKEEQDTAEAEFEKLLAQEEEAIQLNLTVDEKKDELWGLQQEVAIVAIFEATKLDLPDDHMGSKEEEKEEDKEAKEEKKEEGKEDKGKEDKEDKKGEEPEAEDIRIQELTAEIPVLEAELALLESEIDSRLSSLYQLKREELSTCGFLDYHTKLALFHWTILARRSAARSLHTVVDGLDEHEVCAGDFIGDQLLWDYFDLTLDKEKPLEEVSRASAKALGEIARQLACLGGNQILLADFFITGTFFDLETYLWGQGLDVIIPKVINVATGPMLLFYDALKGYGRNTSSFQWWQSHQAVVRAGSLQGSNPLLWQGVWVYDRRSGRMVGFNPNCRETDVNCINAEIFVDSIGRAENLGNGDCTFFEMVARGDTSEFGYLCEGSVCNEVPEESLGVGQTEPLRLLGDSTSSVFGMDREILTEGGYCNSSNQGSDGGDRSGLCQDSSSGLSDPTFQCVMEQMAKNPFSNFLRCFAEATGMCSSPLDSITKDFQAQDYEGLLGGESCQLSQGGDSEELDEEEEQALEWWDDPENREEAYLQFQEELETTIDPADFDQAWETARESIENAQFEAVTNPDNHLAETDADNNITVFAGGDYAEILVHEGLHVVGIESDTTEKEDHEVIDNMGIFDCAPEDTSCGDECTGMDEVTRGLLSCVEQELTPETEFSWDPGYIDPLDPDLPEGWANCFEAELELQTEGAIATRICGNVDCPEDTVCDSGQDGICVTSGAGTGSEMNPAVCGSIDCPEGSEPVFDNGICTCSSAGGGGEGGDAGGEVGDLIGGE